MTYETWIKYLLIKLYKKDQEIAEKLASSLFISLAIGIAINHEQDPHSEIVINGKRKITIHATDSEVAGDE